MAAAETFHIRKLSATAIFKQQETEETEMRIYPMFFRFRLLCFLRFNFAQSR
jgi:hypothetical protein